MRIRVVKAPAAEEVDGIRLDQFRPIREYRLSNGLGALFLAEGWGEPVDEGAAATPNASSGDRPVVPHPPNLLRERFPPYYDSMPILERRHSRRRR
jgi:hypothetical protein